MEQIQTNYVVNALTVHALKRSQQRGIKREVIQLIYDEADQSLKAGDGCEKIRLSKQRLRELQSEGLEAATLEQAQNVVLLISKDGRILTNMHDYGSGFKPSHSRLH